MTMAKQISKDLEVTCYPHQDFSLLEVCAEDHYTGVFATLRLDIKEVLRLKYFLDRILEGHCDEDRGD